MSTPNHEAGGQTLEQELAELFDGYHNMISRAAQTITGRRQDAEDVLQTIFLNLIRNGIPPKLRTNPGGYLREAAIKEAYKVIRTRRRRKVDDNVNVLKIPLPAPPANSDHELRQGLSRAMAALGEDAAEILVLHDMEGRTRAEIAAIKGMSEDAIAKRLQRTRTQVRQLMGF